MTSPTPGDIPNVLPSESPRRAVHTLGPGTLVLGSVGTQLDMSCQLTEIKFTAEANSEDSEAVLCGDTIAGARTYEWQMTGSLFQDIETDGVIDFSWKYAGREMPFKFVPDATGTAAITGRATVDPIEFGGTIKVKNKSEFEWSLVGSPVFNPDANAATEPTG